MSVSTVYCDYIHPGATLCDMGDGLEKLHFFDKEQGSKRVHHLIVSHIRVYTEDEKGLWAIKLLAGRQPLNKMLTVVGESAFDGDIVAMYGYDGYMMGVVQIRFVEDAVEKVKKIPR